MTRKNVFLILVCSIFTLTGCISTETVSVNSTHGQSVSSKQIKQNQTEEISETQKENSNNKEYKPDFETYGYNVSYDDVLVLADAERLNKFCYSAISLYDAIGYNHHKVITKYPEEYFVWKFGSVKSMYELAKNGDDAAQKEISELGIGVGDLGPAGGYVFYDKGHYSDGWRYLEAAPNDLPGKYAWGVDGYIGTSDAVGTGQNNTQIIASRSTTMEKNATQACLEYSLGGYDDWFLPSRDELMLMYKNLHKNGISTFKNAFYWSSSGFSKYDAWFQNFGNGNQILTERVINYRVYVRPVRAF